MEVGALRGLSWEWGRGDTVIILILAILISAGGVFFRSRFCQGCQVQDSAIIYLARAGSTIPPSAKCLVSQYIYIYTYIHIYIYIFIHIYTYIYKERERHVHDSNR